MSSHRRIRLFPTCLGEHFFPRATEDARHLLRGLGVEVDVCEGAGCCGQPAWNAGAVREAETMARTVCDRLLDASNSPVVLPSGSCTAMIRHGFPRLAPDLSLPAYELAEFIVDVLGLSSVGSGLQGLRIAYHHGCHALRDLGVRGQPLTLLRNAGAELVPWLTDQECCGFGGLFAVKLPHVSVAMADRKLDTLERAGGVDILTSADGGCLLQLEGRLRVRRSRQPSSGTGPPHGGDPNGAAPDVVHLATLLRAARDGAGAEIFKARPADPAGAGRDDAGGQA